MKVLERFLGSMNAAGARWMCREMLRCGKCCAQGHASAPWKHLHLVSVISTAKQCPQCLHVHSFWMTLGCDRDIPQFIRWGTITQIVLTHNVCTWCVMGPQGEEYSELGCDWNTPWVCWGTSTQTALARGVPC